MRALAAAICLLTAAFSQAHGTDPDVVALRYIVGDEAVECELFVAPAIFEVWFALQRADLLAFTDAEGQAASAAVARYLDGACPVEIDHAIVGPASVEVTIVQRPFRDRQMDYVMARIRYPASRAPRIVSIAWQRFVVIDVELEGVHAELVDAHRTRSALLTPAEPQVTWHADAPSRVVTQLSTEPRQQERASGWVLGAIAMLVATAVLLLALRGLGGRRPALYGVSVAGVLLAAALVCQGWSESTRRRGPPPPTVAEAEQLFAALLDETYRAFEYSGEQAVYEALARAVAGELLDRLYVEVQRGLISAEAGGAVAQVRELELIEQQVLRVPTADGPFQVTARWRVVGEVVHWGHRHQRTVSYRARFTVRRTAAGWRLSAIEVLGVEAR